jgi:hypothetical protein
VKEGDNMDDLVIDGSRVLKLIGNKYETVDWFNTAQERDKWRAVVRTVIKFWVPWKARNFLTEELSAYRDGLFDGVNWLVNVPLLSLFNET